MTKAAAQRICHHCGSGGPRQASAFYARRITCRPSGWRSAAPGLKVLAGAQQQVKYATDEAFQAYAFDGLVRYCDVKGNPVQSPVVLNSRTAMLFVRNPSILPKQAPRAAVAP
jgi:hypothetical protein